jgi:hypothetical protein
LYDSYYLLSSLIDEERAFDYFLSYFDDDDDDHHHHHVLFFLLHVVHVLGVLIMMLSQKHTCSFYDVVFLKKDIEEGGRVVLVRYIVCRLCLLLFWCFHAVLL